METARTVLSMPKRDDYAEILELQSNEQVRRHLGGPVSKDAFGEKFTGILNAIPPESYWVVREKIACTFMGLVCIAKYHDQEHYEVSYELHPKFWEQGYGTEILQEVIRYGFEVLGLEDLYAETQKKNVASRRLLEKVGMQTISELERFGEDQVVYRIRKSAE